MEIEELKNELSMIVMTQTGTGRERWDTPEVKVAAGKKRRLRKDRYSSLIMANMSARQMSVEKQYKRLTIMVGLLKNPILLIIKKTVRCTGDPLGLLKIWTIYINTVYIVMNTTINTIV